MGKEACCQVLSMDEALDSIPTPTINEVWWWRCEHACHPNILELDPWEIGNLRVTLNSIEHETSQGYTIPLRLCLYRERSTVTGPTQTQLHICPLHSGAWVGRAIHRRTEPHLLPSLISMWVAEWE